MLPKPPVCPHCGNAEIARANLRLAAREKRMREVAEEMQMHIDKYGTGTERDASWIVQEFTVKEWRAKLLGGIKKEDAGT